MQTVTTIGLDIAKSVFQVHGLDAEGNLLARNFPKSDDHRGPMTQAEFLARGWKLVKKARELGWSV
jgi:hypothetical protein